GYHSTVYHRHTRFFLCDRNRNFHTHALLPLVRRTTDSTYLLNAGSPQIQLALSWGAEAIVPMIMSDCVGSTHENLDTTLNKTNLSVVAPHSETTQTRPW